MKIISLRLLHLLLIVLIVLMSGCGMFRSVFKSKEYSKLETRQSLKVDSTYLKVDKSISTIQEKADTIVKTEAKVVKQSTKLDMDSLVKGMTAIKSDLVNVMLRLDSNTGVLEAVAELKPQSVPVKFDKITTKQNDITEQGRKQSASEQSSNQSQGSSTINKSPIKFSGWIVALVVVCLAIAAWLSIKRRN